MSLIYACFTCRWGSNFDDSVFSDAFSGTAKAEPKSAAEQFSGQKRYTGLDFYEDPFKNSNYRYADPFEESGSADPFNKPDPFSAPANQAFGADPFSSSVVKSDPFTSDSRSSDPFAPAPADAPYENSKLTISDPFGSSQFEPSEQSVTNSSSDPFGNSFTSLNSAPNADPFGSSNNFSSSNDPFSLTNLKPLTTNNSSDNNLNSKSLVSSTNSTVSYRKDKVSTDSTVSEKSSKKKSSHHSLSDFLTGSPLKLDKADKGKDKKDKKHGKFHLSSPLKKKTSTDSPKSDKKNKSSSDGNAEEVQMKMASDMSRRADDERRRKLQLQEEADLAYAIALSKAEAASLKNQ